MPAPPRGRQLAARLAAGVFVTLTAPAAAGAHGPCGCLDPVLVQAGGVVRLTDSAGRQAGGAGYPAYRVILNPRPADLGIAPRYLASAYRADAPTTTVLSRPRKAPTRRGRFRVPKGTPPGMYMVLVFDGDEGGAHNTWDYLHVTDWDDPDGRGVVGDPEESGDPPPASPEAPARSDDSGSPSWPLILGIGTGCLVLGFGFGRAAGGRRS